MLTGAAGQAPLCPVALCLVHSALTLMRYSECNIICRDLDSYNSHIQGKKHHKVARYHSRLGKLPAGTVGLTLARS